MAAAEHTRQDRPLIEVKDITKFFGPVVALTGVSMTT